MAIQTAAGAQESGVRASAARTPRRGGGIRGRQATAGWLFTAPAIVLVVLFLVVPMLMALWVSLSNWSGIGSPFSSNVKFVGVKNYSAILVQDGLARQNLMESLRNNFYYVLLVVPLQTVLALFLAVVVNRRRLAGRGFFRTAFYFPSVTSSVAITIVFIFLFSGSGVVNAVLQQFGVSGPDWFTRQDGLIHIVLDKLGVHTAPGFLANHSVLGQSWWEWLAGPSVAMVALIVLAVWTTAGTFMLMFLAALQNIPAEIEEAALVDGASSWERFSQVTLPMLRPTMFLVLTLGLIGTWQVFDAVFLLNANNPTLTTPAYLSYQTSFGNQQWGQGAAISFVLFAIIVVLAALQRYVLRDRDLARERKQQRSQGRSAIGRAG
ncbi:MAG: sugar ABC transporter permease [Actinomycetota bacterium]|nr:sugar ABC transporter permease [Actinomycetota bacterium]MDQ2957248.1 sugar ABC transporter permease [Actinomycetota bacterium]